MKIKFAVTAALLSIETLWGTPAVAKVLTPREALDRVMADATLSRHVRRPSAALEPKVVFTQEDATRQPALYLINFGEADGTYMLLSADDQVPALLGYGDRGADSEGAINPELRYWMEEYARQIEWTRNHPALDKRPRIKAKSDFSPIEPLLKTKWNQNEPYNDLCPEYEGEPCVTGCVATAASQIMKYHEWPKTGVGSYTYDTWSLGYHLTCDFSQTVFDWNSMTDTYDATSTPEQKKAVATLMYAVGVGAQMDYSPYGSGATDLDLGRALMKYFRYKPGLSRAAREYVGVYEWDQIVYEELRDYGPVYYSGQSNGSGHAFVCDGYSSDGYFHINWGWGGLSDGYFLLTVLDPNSQGIGGSTSGYNFNQTILTSLQPDRDGSPSEALPFLTCDGFYFDKYETNTGAYFPMYGAWRNYSMSTLAGTFYIKAVNAATGETIYIPASDVDDFTGYYSYVWVYMPDRLPEGHYAVSPCFRLEDGTEVDIRILQGAPRVTTMTVEGNSISFNYVEESIPEVTDLRQLSDLYASTKFKLGFSVANDSESDIVGSVRVAFFSKKAVEEETYDVLALGDSFPLYMTPGEHLDVDNYISDWWMSQGSRIFPGDYYMAITDYDRGYIVSDFVPVTVNDKQLPATVTVSDFRMLGNPSTADRHNLRFAADVKCEDGYFANNLRLVIFPAFPPEGGVVYSICDYNSEVLFLSKGQGATVNFDIDFSAGEEGKDYFAMIYLGYQSAVDTRINFTLNYESGVDATAVEASEEVSVEFFTLGGLRVSQDNLAPGIYIVRTTLGDGTVTTRKVAVR